MSSYAQFSMIWYYFSIPKLQHLHGRCLGMDKWFDVEYKYLSNSVSLVPTIAWQQCRKRVHVVTCAIGKVLEQYWNETQAQVNCLLAISVNIRVKLYISAAS